MQDSIAADGGAADAEIFAVIIMTAATIGPRVFKNSVRPGADTADIVRRFRGEWLRILAASSVREP
jgi:hypothetical protein